MKPINQRICAGLVVASLAVAGNMGTIGRAEARDGWGIILLVPVAIVVGTGYLAYKAGESIVKSIEADERRRAEARRDPPGPDPAVVAAAAARKRFLAKPLCARVGGYEAYLNKTGRTCRLY